MDKSFAAKKLSEYHVSRFIPAVEAALADGRLGEDLAEDLTEAIRIARSVGPSSSFGRTMIGEVLFTILCESLPKPKKS